MGSSDEKTKVTIPILAALIALAMWLSGVSFQGVANGKDIDEMKKRQDAYEKIVVDIAVIKSEVHEIKKKLNL